MKDINDALTSQSALSSGEEMELEEELAALMKTPTPVPVPPVVTASKPAVSTILPSAPISLPQLQPTIASPPPVGLEDDSKLRDLEKRLAML